MDWSLVLSLLVSALTVVVLLLFRQLRITNANLDRILEANRTLMGSERKVIEAAGKAVEAAASHANRAHDLAKGTFDLRSQCAEILRDMRALRGWPTDVEGHADGR